MNDIREQRQWEMANKWLIPKRGIIHSCPRSGKCKIGINIMSTLGTPTTLICYPDEKIKHSWEEDFIKWSYYNPNIEFTTYLSLHKYIDNSYDLVVLDECHTLSSNQVENCKKLFIKNKQILALTGTLSNETRNYLKKELSLNVEAVYPIEQAIKEGVISNYEIEVIQVPLDDKIIQQFGKKRRTEKKQYNALTFVINKLEGEGKDTFFMRLNRARIIQNSIAKLAKTKELLDNEDRILVFCGTIKGCEYLDIPFYHSKSKDSSSFDRFVRGEGNKLAVCQIGGSGLTYLPLSRVILNSFTSNEEELCQRIMRCMSMEYDNLEKISKITIISSTEDDELIRLKQALKGLNKDKIKYI